MKSRFAVAVLALSLILTAPAASAEEKSGGTLAGVFALFFDFLDNGSALDPSGDDTDSRGGWDPNGFAAADGGHLDPNGLKSAGRDDGIGIDPHGGRPGAAISPQRLDHGATIDPNG